MSAFVTLWLVVAGYQVFDVARGVRSLLLKPGVTVTFHWSFLLLAVVNGSLGTLYLIGAIR